MSTHEDKLIGTLRQVQLNQQEHQGFAFDLDSWADEMKKKEEQMLKKKSGETEVGSDNYCDKRMSKNVHVLLKFGNLFTF
jgi:hypothetical protein